MKKSLNWVDFVDLLIHLVGNYPYSDPPLSSRASSHAIVLSSRRSILSSRWNRGNSKLMEASISQVALQVGWLSVVWVIVEWYECHVWSIGDLIFSSEQVLGVHWEKQLEEILVVMVVHLCIASAWKHGRHCEAWIPEEDEVYKQPDQSFQ